MFSCLLKRFWMGNGLPEIQTFSSASRSTWPAASTLEWVMLLSGGERYSTFLPGRPCLSTRISPVVREDEEVSEQLVSFLDPLVPSKQPGEVSLYLRRLYL